MDKASAILQTQPVIQASVVTPKPKTEKIPKDPSKKVLKEKENPKTIKKKTGYQLYFEDSLKNIKKTPEGKSKKYLEIMVPELSTIISKEWKNLGEQGRLEWAEKAEEFNIILLNLDNLPQKNIEKVSSSDISDTESDEGSPIKKMKAN